MDIIIIVCDVHFCLHTMFFFQVGTRLHWNFLYEFFRIESTSSRTHNIIQCHILNEIQFVQLK